MGGWSEVRLGEVLRRSHVTANLEPTKIYKEITVKWWGKGAVTRREVSGAELANVSSG